MAAPGPQAPLSVTHERDDNYPEGFGRCVMCGAGRNEPCTVISGSGVADDLVGDRRPNPHGGRAPIGDPREPLEGFVPVKDET